MGPSEMGHTAGGCLENLYGKQLIVYGTGNAGKVVIPYLRRNPNIDLRGVTNSRIVEKDEGTYLETGLPLRSLHEWFVLFPKATILIAVFNGYDAVYQKCAETGFQDIIFVSAELVMAAMTAAGDITEQQLMCGLDALCLANEIHDTHVASFSQFKGCNRGRDVAVVGCGPTLNYYSQIPQASHIGTNSCFLKEDLELDYYFLLHYDPEWCEELRTRNFEKFFLVNRNDNSNDKFPEYVVEENNARRFFQAPLTSRIQANIEYHPLMGFCSVIFPAIQFALYTRPKRIFLIGCDCSMNGHFEGRAQGRFEADTSVALWIEGYEKLKIFVRRYYPDTELVSVNPVGLKGMFHDVYTRSCLEAHPEIICSECEILDDYTVKK